jgi:hypothetical protein
MALKFVYNPISGSLDLINTISSAELTSRWWDISPKNGYVLPISQPRAYFPVILFNSTPIFKDPTGTLRKYVSYYAAAASAQGYAAFSDDGITWDHETLVTGVVGNAYHASALVVSGIIHFFYWNTTVSIYSPAATRHATFDPSISCVATTSDNPLSGDYINGPSGGPNMRAGTYGVDQIFYNPAPTSNPANPYSYPWCILHNGSNGSSETILHATSPDGLNFSQWPSGSPLTEVIPRNLTGWDACTGRITTFIDSKGMWHGFYSGGLGTGAGEDTNFGGGIGYATSLDGITWTKWNKNPLIMKTEAYKAWKRLYTPWVILDNSGYKIYFSCKDNAGLYRVAYGTLNGFI